MDSKETVNESHIMDSKETVNESHTMDSKETVNESRLESASPPPEKLTPGGEEQLLLRWSAEEQARIIRKVDLRLIPVCGLLYCASLLDRTNLANAAIAGMNLELNIRNVNGVDRYSLITLMFFITYTIFQPPGGILTRKFGPRLFLSALCFLWGIVVIGFGFAEHWSHLVGMRAVLGLLEAGFFPGVVYLMSTWYKRYEMGKRYACFYLIGAGASAFGGILAYGLMQMDGVAGYRGWRWIFIIEGIMTCCVALVGARFLLSFPDSSNSRSLRFLTADEQQCILERVNVDRGDADVAKFNFRQWLAGGKDWKIWAYALIFGCITTVSYALAYFLPIILNSDLGFSIGLSQCLVAPPYVFSAIVMILTGWWGDKYQMRGPPLVFNAILAIVGLSILGFHDTPGIRYFGVFLAAAGANANIPVCMSYQANNIRGQWKRAFCSATLVGFGSLGGIVGSTVFRAQDRPGYRPGIVTTIASQGVIILLVAILSLDIRRQNAKADRGEKVLEEGDASFRYTF
ncbi:putative phthalate transporter [Drepanopeziza brunnea f. sp. 'multigermtubi' MB_m1]|uniref:Putative phthalate transporter n=1 Tax=Marssonina brunnea f. sp. multigermtubi (strain MB_m1) TaxID=1072389 RepID=K1XU67_MARBU|nr:putative phthalate transporter [Drepanopeziza brunnea f. sp. 'multigermtubi' MB_m1]EKD16149.1 putative phthalate transporter [Drepanopeziza brunnea f. sp. 'multigermtubi' MB_m1]